MIETINILWKFRFIITVFFSLQVREKRKAIEGRKTVLDRYYVQSDYALSFVDYAMQFADSDDKALLMGKRTIERQLRRLKKVDSSTGLQGDSGVKLDLYFQHYASQQMHSSLESVLKQVLSDIKVLSGAPPVPKAPPPAPQPVSSLSIFISLLRLTSIKQK